MKNISNVELRCNNNVDKPVSKETSISEGDSLPVDTGVSTPPSLGSFSQPSGSVSSEAPAEVIVSPEPPGPGKISTRKNRADRFSPIEGLAAILQHTRRPLYSFVFFVSARPEWYLMGPVSALPGCPIGTHPDNSPSSFWFLHR